MDRIRCVLLGLGATGRAWLAALRSHAAFDLVAVADASLETAQLAADGCNAAPYDDFRHALVEQHPDAALFALPPFAAEPYLPIAAEASIPVLLETPLARTFDDAVRLLGWFYQAETPLVVASRWRFDPAVAAALPQLAELLGPAPAWQAMVRDRIAARLDWRGDARRAGGGALLDAGYDLLDLIVAVGGLPGDVLAHFVRPQQAPVDTETAAALLCRFPAGASAALSVVWGALERDERLTALGPGGCFELATRSLHLCGPAGVATVVRRLEDAEQRAAILDSFAATVRDRPAAYPGRASDQLATMALLDAAYLSGRTLTVESPIRPYELAGLPGPRGGELTGVLGL